jgi:hypothetical protein
MKDIGIMYWKFHTNKYKQRNCYLVYYITRLLYSVIERMSTVIYVLPQSFRSMRNAVHCLRWLSSGMLRRVVLKITTTILEALNATIRRAITFLYHYTAQHPRRQYPSYSSPWEHEYSHYIIVSRNETGTPHKLELTVFFLCSTEYHFPTDVNSGGTRTPNGTWTGLFGMIQRNELDVINLVLSMMSIRMEVLDFSVPTLKVR